MSEAVEIPWCGGTLALRRVVVDATLPEASEITGECRRLGVAVATDERAAALAGDLWIGLGPVGGWTGETAAASGFARSCEASIVLERLRATLPEATALPDDVARLRELLAWLTFRALTDGAVSEGEVAREFGMDRVSVRGVSIVGGEIDARIRAARMERVRKTCDEVKR